MEAGMQASRQLEEDLNNQSNTSEQFENYNDENTNDEEDTQYNSTYVNMNNDNESYDEEENLHYKNNLISLINSSGMLLGKNGATKHSMANSSINGNVCNSRRNRVFIDPISEVPILEHYFSIETYPDHHLIEKICENLNKGEYRFKFPKLESRNIQLWFKNHRAKLKRLKSTPSTTTSSTQNSFNNNAANNDDKLNTNNINNNNNTNTNNVVN